MRHFLTTVLAAAALLTACNGTGDKHRQQTEQYRQAARQQYYRQALSKAQDQLAMTDSLLRQAESDQDTLNVQKRIRRDSLRHAADVQGAKIRYIHRKQKELQ